MLDAPDSYCCHWLIYCNPHNFNYLTMWKKGSIALKSKLILYPLTNIHTLTVYLTVTQIFVSICSFYYNMSEWKSGWLLDVEYSHYKAKTCWSWHWQRQGNTGGQPEGPFRPNHALWRSQQVSAEVWRVQYGPIYKCKLSLCTPSWQGCSALLWPAH